MGSETLIAAAANHVWQSTLLAAVAARVAIALRTNHAAARYRLWLLASLKFIAPFAILVALGSHLKTPSLPTAPAARLALIEHFGQPFAPQAAQAMAPTAAPHSLGSGPDLIWVLLFVWMAGALSVLSVWTIRWRRANRVIADALPLCDGREAQAVRRICEQAGLSRPVPVVSSSALLEPGVFGLFRPVLFLPGRVADHLTEEQLEAVVAHEVCHVMRRDNLLAVIHMVIEALFWFHPLVWWIGARLIEEREHACDEAVLRMGSAPHVYAEGILQTCRFYLESPVACMSGVTGSDLKARIVRIMSDRTPRRIGLGKKLFLSAAAVAAVGGPVIFGLFTAPEIRAQAQWTDVASPAEWFELASIKPSDPGGRNTFVNIAPGGTFRATNITAKFLIRVAYHVQFFEITGGPGWINSEKFDVEAKSPDVTAEDPRKMTEDQRGEYERRIERKLQWLLAERFRLAIHRESKDMPIYELTVGNGEPSLIRTAAEDGKRPRGMRMRPGEFEGMGASLTMLAEALSDVTGRKVIDNTGISGHYDFKLDWTPDPGQTGGMSLAPPGAEKEAPPTDASGPSLFTAIQEQLGLKLKSAKGPVEVVIIDRVEKPSVN